MGVHALQEPTFGPKPLAIKLRASRLCAGRCYIPQIAGQLTAMPECIGYASRLASIE